MIQIITSLRRFGCDLDLEQNLGNCGGLNLLCIRWQNGKKRRNLNNKKMAIISRIILLKQETNKYIKQLI
jgi:hypothetical protein